MTRLELLNRTGKLLRDESNSIYSKSLVIDNLNEGINRIKQIIPELVTMPMLLNDTDIPQLLPDHYHHLLCVYAMARCYETDERYMESGKFMNEFEVKINNVKEQVQNGEIELKNQDGSTFTSTMIEDAVTNVYFNYSIDEVDLETEPQM